MVGAARYGLVGAGGVLGLCPRSLNVMLLGLIVYVEMVTVSFPAVFTWMASSLLSQLVSSINSLTGTSENEMKDISLDSLKLLTVSSMSFVVDRFFQVAFWDR